MYAALSVRQYRRSDRMHECSLWANIALRALPEVG